jgi:hypothetical protein
MLPHTTAKITLAAGAKIFENTKAITLTEQMVWDHENPIAGRIRRSVLQNANNQQMEINEKFKILDGRIRLVDNIGLMGAGITTSGFAQWIGQDGMHGRRTLRPL